MKRNVAVADHDVFNLHWKKNTMKISWRRLRSERKNCMIEPRDGNESILTFLSRTMADCDGTFESVNSFFLLAYVTGGIFANISRPLRRLLSTRIPFFVSVKNNQTVMS